MLRTPRVIPGRTPPALARCVVALLAILVPLAMLAGCAREMIPAPYIMRGEAGRALYDAVPPALQTPDIPIIYTTDRAPDADGDQERPDYRYARSARLHYGTAAVAYTPEPTWAELVAASTTGERDRALRPRVARVEPAGELRSTLEHFEVRDGGFAPVPGARERIEAERAPLYDLIARYGEATRPRDVLIFVHGFNNTFDDAVIRLAEAWHASGRRAVPIVFSWPAGSGGALGYAYDRESGEFAILHLKLLLWALAECPLVERIHLVSHSRGTDVASTALRELNAEIRGATGRNILTRRIYEGREDLVGQLPDPDPWRVLKLETLVLAAPDLDIEVFTQRFLGENVLRAARRTVIYFSREDEALGLADWLFRSRRRLGALHVDDIPLDRRPLLAQLDNLQFVNCTVTGGTTHSYVLQHPAALSDLILLLRSTSDFAADPSRPLRRSDECVWNLDDDYLRPGATPAPPPQP